MISLMNFSTLLAISSLLVMLRACNPGSRLHFALTLNKNACTIVIWPDRPAFRLPPLVKAQMNTEKLSTWLLVLWKRSQMWAIRGRPGEEDGTPLTLSTLNSPEPAQEPKPLDQ